MGAEGLLSQILEHAVYGEQARELFADCQELLAEIEADGSLQIRGAYGLWPAVSEGDDIVLDNGLTLPMLRQQTDRAEEPNRSLADFVAPAETGLPDHIGAFAITAGLGADDLVKRYEAEHDDYRAIMVKAIADRLAEAGAEWMHREVRRSWYAPDEALSPEELIGEAYRGIRPAIGYPACPDHALKRRLFDLLEAQRARDGPHRALRHDAGRERERPVLLSTRRARYFNVGPIGKDQLEDYARRLGESAKEAERWLRPNLAYDPD